MNAKTRNEMAARRAGFMNMSTPGEDRFARASKITDLHPTGTSAAVVPVAPVTPAAAPAQARAAEAADVSVTVVVKTTDVIENPLNARHAYKEQRINDLAASIAQRGQLTPALACVLAEVLPFLEGEEADGLRDALTAAAAGGARYLLIGGHYRKKALARLDKPIELKVVPVRNLLDLYALSYAENDEREDTTPLDDALSWKNLLDMRIAKTQEDISRATNKPRATIVKTLALLKLPAEVQDLLREANGPYSFVAGYTLTQLIPHVTRERLLGYAEQVVSGTITTRELEAALVHATADNPVRKTKEISRQHKIHRDGQEVGVIKEWDSGRVLLDIRILEKGAREELVLELRKRFGIGGDSQFSLT